MMRAVARTRPMLRTTRPMRRFSVANTCSTRLCTLARVADAILDRLVHNAHRIEIRGESMRKISARRTTPVVGAL